MPHLDHTGPEGKGPKTGRKLGKCRKTENEKIGILGIGQGKRRKSGDGKGMGKRLKSGKMFGK